MAFSQEENNEKVKVVLVNTKTPGGAYVACQRLAHALLKQGVEVSFVEIKATKWNFLWERFCIFVANYFSRKNLFAVSIANTGTDISKLKVVREADIIHLHWINQGGLSLKNIAQLQSLGKPIVWTMHDMWPFTGICHHANECIQYQKACLSCPKSSYILASKTFYTKRKIWHNISFVGCSRWIASLAKQSALTVSSQAQAIPNPLDIKVFSPIPKETAREKLGLPIDKKYVLFGAVNSTASEKGFQYLLKADKQLLSKNVHYLVVGRNGAKVINQLGHDGTDLGYVSDDNQKALIYSAADVFVTPSLAENLPNMIMESMACGTPCVGFEIGGIPEMIDHKKNGYVAKYKDAEDFARGIDWILATKDNIGVQAIEKVETTYAEPIVAEQFINLYQSLLTK